jgi:hypothetical protein
MHPTNPACLVQAYKNALLVAAFNWKQSLYRSPDVPNESEWGWECKNEGMGAILDKSTRCALLFHCGCLVVSKGKCK